MAASLCNMSDATFPQLGAVTDTACRAAAPGLGHVMLDTRVQSYLNLEADQLKRWRCRLQPSAIVTDEDCAACEFNHPGKTCLRPMEWVWRGETFSATASEYYSLKNQLQVPTVITATCPRGSRPATCGHNADSCRGRQQLHEHCRRTPAQHNQRQKPAIGNPCRPRRSQRRRLVARRASTPTCHSRSAPSCCGTASKSTARRCALYHLLTISFVALFKIKQSLYIRKKQSREICFKPTKLGTR